MISKRVSICLFLTGFVFSAQRSPAAPIAKAGPEWSVNDPSNPEKLDHGLWQDFLGKYLDTTIADGINRVRYGSVNDADRKSLEEYLTRMQETKVSSLNRQEQKAFWINLYNATTVSVILRKYPVGSIRDIRFSMNPLKSGPWDAELLKVENRKLSLNDVEHGILRSLWKDNRVHFAVNCASLGCPNLSPLAFTSENLDGFLEKGARDFINSSRGASMEGKTLVLSSIFDWYRSDFGSDEKQVMEFLSRYARPEFRDQLKGFSGSIKYQYDWNLNDARAAHRRGS